MFSAKICFTHSTSPVAELHGVDYHTIRKSEPKPPGAHLLSVIFKTVAVDSVDTVIYISWLCSAVIRVKS